MPSTTPFALSCALALPLSNSFEINLGQLATHAGRCLATGCSSITVFGTTGEGASLSLAEREQILSTLSNAGFEMDRQVLGGVMATSVGDAVEQARVVIAARCRGMLLAPPFYYKEVTEAGLYAWFSQVFERIEPQGVEVILYHIPPVTGVPLSVRLIGRLRKAFPEIVKGMKDSGNDWSYTEELLRTHGDLLILIGNERHLAAGVRTGAKGAISGLANLCPKRLRSIMETGIEDPRVTSLVSEIARFPFTPAVKSLLAQRDNDPSWLAVRPPLSALSESERAELATVYERVIS
jgi:4-hydroxy-tetrahydrodipicolinate synthase